MRIVRSISNRMEIVGIWEALKNQQRVHVIYDWGLLRKVAATLELRSCYEVLGGAWGMFKKLHIHPTPVVQSCGGQ